MNAVSENLDSESAEPKSAMAYSPAASNRDLVCTFENVVCILGGFPALSGLSLDVGRGEILWITGPNGAGKTTALKLMAGLRKPYRGEVSFIERGRYVGHNTGLYEALSAVEHFDLQAQLYNTERHLFDRWARALDVRDLGKSVGKLSEGQRRRVAMACGIATSSKLLLLDEPHAGVDNQGKEAIDRAIGQYIFGGGTVVFASHELDRARRLASRAVQLVNGRVPLKEIA